MPKRIVKSYKNAWTWAGMREEPFVIRWLYRLALFGSPIAFIASATAFGLATDDWWPSVFFYLFIVFSHPAIITFIYYDYFYLIEKRNNKE